MDAMSETFVHFNEPIVSSAGTTYFVRVCARQDDIGRWEGWLEFEPTDNGPVLRSPRETVQPNRTDLAYWAGGLTRVYLDGALERAELTLREPVRPPNIATAPTYEGPAPDFLPAGAVLDPFAVYRQGEHILRRQLAALAPSHLREIIHAYQLGPADGSGDLVERIVRAVGSSAH
jgi:hypothetical protein